MAHEQYCMTEKAFVTNGKYSSIAVMSVPRAFRNSPDTVSRSSAATLATHLTMPSKIQSSIDCQLLPYVPV